MEMVDRMAGGTNADDEGQRCVALNSLSLSKKKETSQKRLSQHTWMEIAKP